MATANDSVTVTPGSGATIATHLAASKEHQVTMRARPSGQLEGTEDIFFASTGNTAHVAAARTTLFDMFNAVGSGVTLRVRGIYIIPAQAAVTGVGQTYEIIRTSAVGTGGSTVTPVRRDSTGGSALSGSVTARTKPTGGATTAATLLFVNGSSEETTPYVGLASQINHVPAGCELVLNPGEGIKVDQTTNSSVGNLNVLVVFSQE